MASRGLHPNWWPVIGLAVAFALLDVLVLFVFLAAAAKSPGEISGHAPFAGWGWFAVFLALEPSWVIPLLVWHTSKGIKEEERAIREGRAAA